MDNLVAQSPLSGLLPISAGNVRLSEADLGQISLLLRFDGQRDSLSKCLKQNVGLSLPAPNRSAKNGTTRLVWFGREAYLLTGADVPKTVLDIAAVTDQSDAWACIEIAGVGVEDVLARLVPVELRPQVFATDDSARTFEGHMQASITRLAEDRLLDMVFRSMAETLVEELKEAMEAVAARG